MTKQEIIEHLNQYVDQIVEQHKREQFTRYVKSKKVTFEECYIFALIRRFQSKRTHINNTIKGE